MPSSGAFSKAICGWIISATAFGGPAGSTLYAEHLLSRLDESDAGYNDSTLSATQSVTYTEGGNSKTVTTTYNYDGWGRVVSTVDPNGGQINMTYDAVGRM